MAKRLDSDGYWKAYGPLRPMGYVPTLSLVGMARACGIKADDPVLRAYVYLASHSKRGDWLSGGDLKALEDYIADCAFDEIGCTTADVSAVTATYEQIGTMYPTHAEKSRAQTARNAVQKLIDSGAIVRVREGRVGKASLYAFLPLTWKDENGCHYHRWPTYELNDYLADSGDESAPDFMRRDPWPWDS